MEITFYMNNKLTKKELLRRRILGIIILFFVVLYYFPNLREKLESKIKELECKLEDLI